MPQLRTIMNIALGYGAKAEDRSGPRYRKPSVTLPYGAHALQALDLHLLGGPTPRPLIAFIHGGAWQFGDKTRRIKDAKVPFAHAQGYHFASLNFRQVPQVDVRSMAQDVAAAVAKLVEDGPRHGVDAGRIVLMGHSSGAHLAALVLSDPALLGEHGLTHKAIAAAILIDGAAYDPKAPSTSSPILRRLLLDPAFASLDELSAVSPKELLQKHEGPIPPCLILHGSAPAMVQQSARLEEAMYARAPVERHGLSGRGIINHMRLSRRFGQEGFATTELARDWLKRQFG